MRRRLACARSGLVLVVGATLACGAGSSGGDGTVTSAPGGGDAGVAESGAMPSDAAAADAAGDASALVDGSKFPPPGARPLPRLTGTSEMCKLINGQSNSDPTANQTQTRANLLGTDLGIPVDHEGTLYFFFGDSQGYKGIWQPGQSLPDAVGFASAPSSTVAAMPQVLCSGLSFLTLPPAQSVGPMQDPSIVADFAAGWMTAPSGQPLSQYIHNPAGNGAYTQLPGDFEVPSGAFSAAGSIYLFYTTVDSPSDVVMKASYLAQWAAPATTAGPGYQILYPVDEIFDGNGPLYGDFVNVAAEVSGAYVYLFGTGDYRNSPIHLARKSLADLGTPGGFELYDAAGGAWGTTRGAPIVDVPGFGETSVRYFAAIDRWMLIAEEQTPQHNQIVARFADAPEGPWSGDIVVYDMADPAFRNVYCCNIDACVGQQIIHCNDAGFYATYLLPQVQLLPGGGFVVTHTMSTWDPYNVVLMQATFATSADGG
ncbi:MAG TPA: DUF4185 domain-containing protein [Polyangiaceae bacterium]